ncbi:MAG: hypothetical protein IIY28_01515 [Lachnospiraceae bacterium]|nr:hypothetical protein [Lachnospiraceae bacterium]
MVRMIHKLTGSVMLVAEDKVEEYKAAGHKVAVDIPQEPVKKTTKTRK